MTGERVTLWALVRALVGVSIACAAVIVTLYELTRPVIETHRVAGLRAALREVLPEAATVRSFRRLADGSITGLGTLRGGGDVVHAGFDLRGRLVGLAFEGQGAGYQDTIAVLLGYDPRGERIIGMSVLASRETPGLGELIRTDERFLASFRDLDVGLDPSGDALAHPVELALPGRERRPWQIDGVSGATVSSRAVARMTGASALVWARVLRGRLDWLEEE